MCFYRIFITSFFALLLSFSASAASSYTFSGKPVKISQSHLQIGERTPSIDLIDSDLRKIRIGGSSDKTQVIATILSIGTPVCQAEIEHLDEMASKMKNTRFVIVASESPLALAAFTKDHNLTSVKLASDFRNKNFSEQFGTHIVNTKLKGLNARSVFVINPEGKLTYMQHVKELNRPPNYKNLQVALKNSPGITNNVA